MSKPQYVAARVMPCSWSRLGLLGAHGRREFGDLRHIDPARTPLNRFGSDLHGADPRDPKACVAALIAKSGATQRGNVSRIAAEVIFFASPSWFLTEEGDRSPERIEAFLQAVLSFARQRWPGQIASWRLDLDETTPHLSVFIVPISHRITETGRAKTEISYRDAFGHPRHLRQLQTDIAAAFAHLGFSRGRSKRETGAIHQRPGEMRSALERAAMEAVRASFEAREHLEEAGRQREQAEAFRHETERALRDAGEDRVAAAMALAEATSLLAFARTITDQARRLLPTLAVQARNSVAKVVAGIGELSHVLCGKTKDETR